MRNIKNNRNLFYDWWHSIDKVIFSFVLLLIALSSIFVTTASSGVAERIGLEQFYFIKRQLIFLFLSLIIIFVISSLHVNYIVHITIFFFLVFLLLMVLVLFLGEDIKGAKRWLSFMGFSIQPSEFIKPFFVMTTSWILSRNNESRFLSYRISLLLYVLVVSLLILQPDFGMVVTITAVWVGQLFLAGISIFYILYFIIFSMVGLTGAYLLLPHVAFRINSFLDPTKSENYQIKKSIEAFSNGGFYGKGPGEGIIKQYIPDSHSDFIFAVIAEEFGLLTCAIVALIYLSIIVRGTIVVLQKKDLFLILSVVGLLMQFGIQAFINMGVALNILPTKGMTLPFISYGGSSVLAISLSIGFILSLTKKRYGIINNKNFNVLNYKIG